VRSLFRPDAAGAHERYKWAYAGPVPILIYAVAPPEAGRP